MTKSVTLYNTKIWFTENRGGDKWTKTPKLLAPNYTTDIIKKKQIIQELLVPYVSKKIITGKRW